MWPTPILIMRIRMGFKKLLWPTTIGLFRVVSSWNLNGSQPIMPQMTCKQKLRGKNKCVHFWKMESPLWYMTSNYTQLLTSPHQMQSHVYILSLTIWRYGITITITIVIKNYISYCFLVFSTCNMNVDNIKEYFVKYCQSHTTLLWIQIMLCMHKFSLVLGINYYTKILYLVSPILFVLLQ